jgi:nucleoid-associated protein YgaU
MAVYTVKPGDTLWGIAQSQCGDGSLWPRIYHDNRWVIGSDPNVIRPGQRLNVNCPTGHPCTWYEVRPGDNLTTIARHFCGTDDWHKIYNDNKDVIGDDPNLIFPGQVLCIRC